jgi:HTH-type transcriptional regulator/antitoxin HigA
MGGSGSGRPQCESTSAAGRLLQVAIAARGLSQSSLARLIGTGQSHVSKLVQGRQPISPRMALRIERALGLPAALLLGAQESERLARLRAEATHCGVSKATEPPTR